MKLSQFITAPRVTVTESHVESADILNELKGLQKQLDEVLLNLSETSQLGHRISALDGVETSYFHDINEAGAALKEQIENLRSSVESYGNETAEEEEEEIENPEDEIEPAVFKKDQAGGCEEE